LSQGSIPSHDSWTAFINGAVIDAFLKPINLLVIGTVSAAYGKFAFVDVGQQLSRLDAYDSPLPSLMAQIVAQPLSLRAVRRLQRPAYWHGPETFLGMPVVKKPLRRRGRQVDAIKQVD